MPRIVFYLESVIYQHDIAVLSSYLRSIGINYRVLFREVEGDRILNVIEDYSPSYVIFPSELRAHGGVGELVFSIVKTAEEVKRRLGIPTVLFGRQATIAADELIKRFFDLDYIVVGDPEYPIRDLVLTGEANNVSGLVYRDRDKRLVKNPVGTQTDLSSLPRPDYNAFFQFKGADKLGFFVPVSRGCVYSCAFCQNAHLKKKVTNKESYMRFYPPNWLIDNLVFLNETHGPINNIYFTDTNFTYSEEFLKEFISLYKQKLNIPFVCATRANRVNERVARLLKEGNCSKVNIGVESGNENVRNRQLKKGITDEQIKKCVIALKSNNIRVTGNIIIALPGETFGAAMSSIEKTRQFGFDSINVSLFQPYYGTDLTNVAIGEGLLDHNFCKWSSSANKMQGKSSLKMPDIRKIENLQILSKIFLRFPHKSLFSLLCAMPKNRFYFAAYHLPRVRTSLMYEFKSFSIWDKLSYLVTQLYYIFIKKERGYNR